MGFFYSFRRRRWPRKANGCLFLASSCLRSSTSSPSSTTSSASLHVPLDTWPASISPPLSQDPNFSDLLNLHNRLASRFHLPQIASHKVVGSSNGWLATTDTNYNLRPINST